MKSQKKILLIYPVNFDGKTNRGIYIKMKGQGEAFEILGYNVTYAFLEKRSGVVLHKGKKKVFIKSRHSQWTKYRSFFIGLQCLCSANHFDIYYIRHLIHSRSLHSFLLSVKSESSQVFYEYPTFPYTQEWMKPLHKILLLEDAHVNKKLSQCIDKVVHFGGYNGPIDAIKITNGINIQSDIIIPKYTGGTFSMIAIGRWEYWHGLDRILKGIEKSNEKVLLNIVGDGPVVKKYKDLIQALNLVGKVVFHPSLYGSELESLLSQSHLGIGTLALHRKRVALDSSLKHRLYCSYGLPFLFAGRDGDFRNDLEFVFNAKADEQPISITEVKRDYISKNIDQAQIKNFASNNLAWKDRMRLILDN